MVRERASSATERPSRLFAPRDRNRAAAAGLLVMVAFASVIMPTIGFAQDRSGGQTAVGGSGLPVPRFVSLKAQPVNMRKGPGTQYPTVWVMRRVGMPLEIIREFQGWRQVRDMEGATGWILGSLLSGRRTAVVQPWDRAKPTETAQSGAGSAVLIDLLKTRNASAGVLAKLEAGTQVQLRRCDGQWCEVVLQEFRGFVEQWRLWGVYKTETVR